MGIVIAVGAVVLGFLLLATKLLGKNNKPFNLEDIEIKEWKDDDDENDTNAPKK